MTHTSRDRRKAWIALDQGLEAQAVVAFDQAAQGRPSASILYRLGRPSW